MAEEVSRQLGEIAALLRQRIEVAERAQQFQEERHRESEARQEAVFERFQESMPKLELPQLDFNDVEHTERMQKLDQQLEEDRRERYQFHERLLTALERQNAILERIAARLEPRG